MSVPARPDDIDHEVFLDAFNSGLQRPPAKNTRCCCEVFGSALDTFDVEGGEKGTELHGVYNARGEDVFERKSEVVGGEVED